MPLWLPPSLPGRFITSAENITVTAGGTAHTKGAWTQLIASTAADAYWLHVVFADVAANNTNTAMLVDIGIGPAGSESVLVPDLNVGSAAWNRYLGKQIGFPLYVPAGSRLLARAQAAIASDTVLVHLFLCGDPPGGVSIGSLVTAYGVDAANSRGVLVTGSNNWVQVVAATARDHCYWFVLPAQGGSTVLPFKQEVVELGFGPAGSERVIGRWVYASDGGQEHMTGPLPAIGIYRSLPSGARIAVRCANVDPTHTRDFIVYAVS